MTLSGWGSLGGGWGGLGGWGSGLSGDSSIDSAREDSQDAQKALDQARADYGAAQAATELNNDSSACTTNSDCGVGYVCSNGRCIQQSAGSTSGGSGAGNCELPKPPLYSPPAPCGTIGSSSGTSGCSKPSCGAPLPNPDGTTTPCPDGETDGGDGVEEGGRCSRWCDSYYKSNGEHWPGCNDLLVCKNCFSCGFFSSKCDEPRTGDCRCATRSEPCKRCDSNTGQWIATSPCYRRYCLSWICKCRGQELGSPFTHCSSVDITSPSFSGPRAAQQSEVGAICRQRYPNCKKPPADNCVTRTYEGSVPPCPANYTCTQVGYIKVEGQPANYLIRECPKDDPNNPPEVDCGYKTYYGSVPPCPSKTQCSVVGVIQVEGQPTATIRKECPVEETDCRFVLSNSSYVPCSDCETCNNSDGKCYRKPECDEVPCNTVCGGNCCRTQGAECVTMTSYRVADTCHNQPFTFCSSGGYSSQFVEYIPKESAICDRGHIHTDIYGYDATGSYVLFGRNLDGAAQPYKIGTCGEGCKVLP